MSNPVFLSLFEAGQLGDDYDNAFQLAAVDGYVMLNEKTAVPAKGGAYELADLLLPDVNGLSRQNAYRCGTNIFPTWFQYDERDFFTYTDQGFADTFIRSHHLLRRGAAFEMDGKDASTEAVKRAVFRSLSIVRVKAGGAVESAYKAILTTCTSAPQDVALFPSWFIADKGEVNEMAFAKYLADKTGWKKAGRIIRTAEGQPVSTDTVKKTIAEEIAPYCPTGTTRRINSLYKLMDYVLPETQTEDSWDIISAAELATTEIKAPVFAVNQLLPAGLTVLAAPPKTGKSWLCLALADAVATGQKFMGYDVNAGDVLYLALEDSRYRVKQRLQKIGSAIPDNLKIVTTGARRLDNGLLLQMEKWIMTTPTARLIVVDTLARVRPMTTYGLDAYNADTATIAPLQAMALEHDVAIILVTHFSKAKQMTADADPFDRITGSNGLFGVADAAWLIYGKRGGEDYTFRTTGRDSMDNEFAIAFDKTTFRWSMLGTSESLEEQKRLDKYRADPLAQTIVELVNDGGRWEGTAPELMQEAARRKQVFVGDAREIGAQVAEMAKYLLQVDGITFTKGPGGRRGRGYSFERVTPLA